jgi:hypothetical protein
MSMDTNPKVPPGQPDDNDEPTAVMPDMYNDKPTSDYPEPDILDLIDATVAQITPAEIEDRLTQTLRRAGYTRHPGASSPVSVSDPFACPDATHSVADDFGRELGRILAPELQQIRRITPGLVDQWRLLEAARYEVLTARQEAEQIVGAAREKSEQARTEAAEILEAASQKSDQALGEAAKIIRDARDQAQRIISDAYQEAEQIQDTAGKAKTPSLFIAHKPQHTLERWPGLAPGVPDTSLSGYSLADWDDVPDALSPHDGLQPAALLLVLGSAFITGFNATSTLAIPRGGLWQPRHRETDDLSIIDAVISTPEPTGVQAKVRQPRSAAKSSAVWAGPARKPMYQLPAFTFWQPGIADELNELLTSPPSLTVRQQILRKSRSHCSHLAFFNAILSDSPASDVVPRWLEEVERRVNSGGLVLIIGNANSDYTLLEKAEAVKHIVAHELIGDNAAAPDVFYSLPGYDSGPDYNSEEEPPEIASAPVMRR